MQLCLTKLSLILEIDPCDITRFFFFNERIIAATSNFKGVSAKNDSLLQKEEIVRIYPYSKYLDRNVRWALFILAEYIVKQLNGWSQRIQYTEDRDVSCQRSILSIYRALFILIPCS